jgi:hypothetical protein
MPISESQIAPLLQGTYAGHKAAGCVVTALVLKSCGASIAKLWHPVVGTDRSSFVLDTLGVLYEKVTKEGGLTRPAGAPPADYTPWITTVVLNSARDLIRRARRAADRQERHTELDEVRHADSPHPNDPTESGPSDSASVAEKRLEAFERLRAHSPLYVVGLACWINPQWLTREMLEAATRVTRGHQSTDKGLVRPVDEVLVLLKQHRHDLSNGLERNRHAQVIAAWILRSDEANFVSWSRDARKVNAGRETLSKWYRRAREKLKLKSPGEDT